MGSVLSSAKIHNLSDPTKVLRCDAVVDTGTSYIMKMTTGVSIC
jgi:hypothetical protein